ELSALHRKIDALQNLYGMRAGIDAFRHLTRHHGRLARLVRHFPSTYVLFWHLVAGYKKKDVGCWILDVGCAGLRRQWKGCRSLDVGGWQEGVTSPLLSRRVVRAPITQVT